MAPKESSVVETEGNAGPDISAEKGYFLRWSRLTKRVEIKDAAGGGLMRGSIASREFSGSFKGSFSGSFKKATIKKTILNEVSGCAAPGEVLALMGPSGSGKTSLLNTVSGRSSYCSGQISINGDVLNPQSMKRLMAKVAYVKQADIFFEHLTVQDQLTYTALLRLPPAMSREKKHAEVERVIKLLRLSKVAQSPIMLLSGGEKKRVNIGTELLTDPYILLLDEPTSGLDSTSAVSLLQLLQSLARDHGKTVITSIHQPSSGVFRSFDKLNMMSEGCVVYFGKPVDSLDYLRKVNLACPDGYNAADHWMDLLVKDSSIQEENEEAKLLLEGEKDSAGTDATEIEMKRKQFTEIKKLQNDDSPRARLEEMWDGEAVAEEMDRALVSDDNKSEATDGTGGENNSPQLKTKKYNTSWLTQFLVLTHRCLKNSRSAIFTPLNLMKSILIGLISGLVWWQMPYTEATLVDRSAYFFFTMSYWVFDSMFGALMAFPTERMVIMKERASGSYHLSAYFMAKTCSDAPVRIALPFLYMIPSFWMARIDDRFSVFCSSTACTLLSCLAGEALGLFVGTSILDMEKAMTVMTVTTLGLMLVGGFFVQNIPQWLMWSKFLSPFKYAFDASLQLVFNRPMPCDGSGILEEACGGSDTGYATADEVQNFLNIQGSVAFNAGMLLVITFVPRYFGYLALRRSKAGDRS